MPEIRVKAGITELGRCLYADPGRARKAHARPRLACSRCRPLSRESVSGRIGKSLWATASRFAQLANLAAAQNRQRQAADGEVTSRAIELYLFIDFVDNELIRNVEGAIASIGSGAAEFRDATGDSLKVTATTAVRYGARSMEAVAIPRAR